MPTAKQVGMHLEEKVQLERFVSLQYLQGLWLAYCCDTSALESFFYPLSSCETPIKKKQRNKPLAKMGSFALWKLGHLEETKLSLGSVKLPCFNIDKVQLSDLKCFAYRLIKIMNFTRVEKSDKWRAPSCSGPQISTVICSLAALFAWEQMRFWRSPSDADSVAPNNPPDTLPLPLPNVEKTILSLSLKHISFLRLFFFLLFLNKRARIRVFIWWRRTLI